MSPPPCIVWLRDDLRLADNPALHAAREGEGALVVLFVLDEQSPGIRPLGGASKWWLHHSLAALDASLKEKGQHLVLRRGPAEDVLRDLVRETKAKSVFWNRRYGGPERDVDAAIKADLKEHDVAAESFQASLLFEPWTVATGSGNPFRVYTPFWRACLGKAPPREPLPAPRSLPKPVPGLASETLADWKLLPTRPNWAKGFAPLWTPGEAGAKAKLKHFLDRALPNYKAHRDEPSVEAGSRLSPHLRFGEISPFQLWHALDAVGRHGEDVEKFRSELGWREFCWHLLFHKPDLATENFQPRFDAFPWAKHDAKAIEAWQQGRTGFPIVDAGMRELWQTGFMHNRVRMIAASFLIKNLLTDWRSGEAWFWDTLVDADAASNPANWQWVAGSGADAAPYFRVFNPVLQGEKFDSKGSYVREFVLELAKLPDAKLHSPWKDGGAKGYPEPIVDLSKSRQRALSAFATLRETE